MGRPIVGNRLDRWVGGASGKGISSNILQAYQFISNNFERGDQIYLFGFSWGAYTARSLSMSPAKAANCIIPSLKLRGTARMRSLLCVLLKRRPIAFTRQAMHYASRAGVERITMMHDGAVIPDNDIADLPLVMPTKLQLRSMRPQSVQQLLGRLKRKPIHVGVRPPTQI